MKASHPPNLWWSTNNYCKTTKFKLTKFCNLKQDSFHKYTPGCTNFYCKSSHLLNSSATWIGIAPTVCKYHGINCDQRNCWRCQDLGSQAPFCCWCIVKDTISVFAAFHKDIAYVIDSHLLCSKQWLPWKLDWWENKSDSDIEVTLHLDSFFGFCFTGLCLEHMLILMFSMSVGAGH
jgi:hypothetical protein